MLFPIDGDRVPDAVRPGTDGGPDGGRLNADGGPDVAGVVAGGVPDRLEPDGGRGPDEGGREQVDSDFDSFLTLNFVLLPLPFRFKLTDGDGQTRGKVRGSFPSIQ